MTGSNMSNALANAVCQRCQARFAPAERIVNSNGELYHEHCFVCAQCFRPFPEGLFYEFEGRKYCEHDFQMLFAPCCGSCGEFIIGRVIKAMNNNWHPGCFRCELCDVELADLGFVKNAGRHLCRPCHNREKAKGLGKYVCQRCHLVIDEQPLMFKNDAYHPDHFSCTHCGKELTAEARELKGELYCLPCHDKMGVPICGACRRPIEGRVVNALGKQWHVEVSEARRWRWAHCCIWSPALQLLHTPTARPLGLLLPLGAAPPCPWPPQEPVELRHRPKAAASTYFPLPSWPSGRFRSHKKTLGTVCLKAPSGIMVDRTGCVQPHVDTEAGTPAGGAPQVCVPGAPGTLASTLWAPMALQTLIGREACVPWGPD
uniref:LIM and senescent cell antigen-like-containing domain protein 2 isoform X3 n=1 Tax=Nyctereutes procyonoides TaxID=34880 RepID=UPI0024444DCD|nr:LIM and senescent cell antigen-like-containing domain protein 2 isoform X3 [Nyctereutes procyonoides]